jgi:hypothetical protein
VGFGFNSRYKKQQVGFVLDFHFFVKSTPVFQKCRTCSAEATYPRLPFGFKGVLSSVKGAEMSKISGHSPSLLLGNDVQCPA